MAVVLCTGVDTALIATRVMILERAGHKVYPAVGEHAVVAVCKRQPIDVAVVGQTVSAPEKRRIFELVRSHCPQARVLELYSAAMGKVLTDADDWLDVPTDVPSNLSERVNDLASRA